MRLHFGAALLPGGWARDVLVELDAGRIAAVRPGESAPSGVERHALAVPGLPNLHSHAFQRAIAGRTERRGPGEDSFWSWRDVMYRSLPVLTPEDVEAIAALAYAEMLESGFTRVGEFHYLHHAPDGRCYDDPAEMASRIAAAAAETGLRLTLLPVLYAHAGFGGLPPLPGQRRFVNDLDGFARLLEGSARAIASLEGAGLGVAPHSLRAVTPEELAAVLSMLPGRPVHIHAAEQVREVEECLAWSGARPVDWLLDHAGPDRRWCLVHATHMLPGEAARLARTGAVAGLCPVTEANLGDGVFDAESWGAAEGAWGVGTDSNVSIAANGELRMLEYSQRLARRGRNLMAPAPGASTGRTLFEAALAGGSRALGEEAPALRPGAPADLVALRPAPGITEDEALDHWIFAAADRGVDTVWCAGRAVVREGRHVARDAIEARNAAAMRRIAGASAG
ncbi:formimidoylglutamate deiminase [Muricoccus pecuniae]|uniref:Formiminoglutamate deiminase n=1 Tax=Muricoccus pecuniae TaxID=693023 RepID=A0A840YD59_9PROT|nr:formimidoylglutamate deiminase [Roseomonas pecuniae]MBB5694061.1 formiminoglutamate deiminase [Roseomonas pecuniae]